MITLSPLQPKMIDDVLRLSDRLASDPLPCSYWGLTPLMAAELLQGDQKYTVVAHVDDKIAGIGSFTRGRHFQKHLAELSIAIDPDHRKRGIARMILSALEERALEDGIELLKALIATANEPSRRLFESLRYEHRATLFCEFKSQEFGEIDNCVYYKRIHRNVRTAP